MSYLVSLMNSEFNNWEKYFSNILAFQNFSCDGCNSICYTDTCVSCQGTCDGCYDP